MPKISPMEFKTEGAAPAPQQEVTPDAFGAAQAGAQKQFGEALGEAGQSTISTADFLQKQAGESEVSDLTVKLAKAQSDYTSKWQDELKNGDPGDMQMASNFMEDYDNNAQDTRDQIQTRAGQLHFDKANAVLRQHFADTANAGQAEMLGVQQQSNFVEARQQRMATVAADPGSYQTAKALQNQDVDTLLVGKIPRNKAEEERLASNKMIAEAAVRGQILADPSQARAELEGGKWDTEVDSTVKYHLLSEARAGVRMQRTDMLLAEQARKAALQQAQEATKNQFLNQINDPKDPNGALNWKQIFQSNLDPSDKEHFNNILQRAATDGENPKNPALFNEAMRRISLPDGDPDKLTDDTWPIKQVAAGLLPYGDATKIRTEMQGRKSEQGQMEARLHDDFLKNVATPSITKDNPVAGFMDTDGHNRLYNFQYQMDKKIQAQRQANKPIEDLYNPESPDYLGQYIPQYQKSMSDVITDFSKKMSAQSAAPKSPAQTAAPVEKPKRKSGETPQQYLDRISK